VVQDYAGIDCGFEVSELQVKSTIEKLGVPFTSDGKFDPDVDLVRPLAEPSFFLDGQK
jgi:hypothetical protein